MPKSNAQSCKEYYYRQHPRHLLKYVKNNPKTNAERVRECRARKKASLQALQNPPLAEEVDDIERLEDCDVPPEPVNNADRIPHDMNILRVDGDLPGTSAREDTTRNSPGNSDIAYQDFYRHEGSEVTGVSQNGRVSKMSSKLMRIDSPNAFDDSKDGRVKIEQEVQGEEMLERFEDRKWWSLQSPKRTTTPTGSSARKSAGLDEPIEIPIKEEIIPESPKHEPYFATGLLGPMQTPIKEEVPCDPLKEEPSSASEDGCYLNDYDNFGESVKEENVDPLMTDEQETGGLKY